MRSRCDIALEKVARPYLALMSNILSFTNCKIGLYQCAHEMVNAVTNGLNIYSITNALSYPKRKSECEMYLLLLKNAYCDCGKRKQTLMEYRFLFSIKERSVAAE